MRWFIIEDTMNEVIFFSLNIPPAEFERYYRGTASRVLVQASDGRRVQIPAASLRRFVTHEGVRGRFRLVVDERHRLLEIERV